MSPCLAGQCGGRRGARAGDVALSKRLVPCGLCGSTQFEVLYADELGEQPAKVDYDFSPETRKTYQIVKCRSCALVYTNPMPNLDEAYGDTVDHHILETRQQRHYAAARELKRLRRFKPGGRLLDVGCSTGYFLDVAAQHFETEGLELSRWARDEAAKRHTVHEVPLQQMEVAERYDVVTLWDVIEHFQDPAAELRAIAGAMKSDGLLVIHTGDIDAWLPRLMGKEWWWFQGMHLHFFSRTTLTRMLEASGFSVVDVGTNTRYFRLFSLSNSLNRYAIGALLAPLLNLPLLRNLMVPVHLNGEMLMFAKKR